MSNTNSNTADRGHLRGWPVFVLLCLAAVFAFGLVTLFKLRYETGDVYPPYSSLRTDPLGTMVFYESLERMPALSVWRDFSSDNHLPESPRTTYFHLAADRDHWESLPEELAGELQAFLLRGGRLVVAFSPELTRPFIPPTPGGRTGAKAGPKAGPGSEDAPQVSLHEKWGVDLGYVSLHHTNDNYEPLSVTRQSNLALPDSLDWHSGMVFTNLDPEWSVIYARDTNAVLIERKIGPGTLVFCSDSYFVSNEAMVRARHADLLRWLVGPARAVAFDEAHLGIVESPGVASLMRQYRLHGLLAGLLLLAALFIWKNSVSFVPPQPETDEPGQVTGKDANSGFINLLRRNIAPADVLPVCFEEWTKSLGRGSGIALARVDRAQAVLEAEAARAKTEREPVRAYREICQALQVNPMKKD